MIRTFLALRIDERILDEVAKIQQRMAAFGADVKWVPMKKQHVTVKFFGYVTDEQLEALKTGITASAAVMPACTVKIRGTGSFGTRVLWAGVLPSNDSLKKLSDGCDRLAHGLNLKMDNKPFNPHLTLGRFRSPKNSDRLMAFVMNQAATDFGEFPCSECILFKSDLRPDGAEYTELMHAKFKSA